MRALVASSLLLLLTASAAAEDAVWPPPDMKFEVVPYGPDVFEGGEGVSNILYINRCADGCDITKSETNNALTEESSIPEGAASTYTVQPFGHGDPLWEELMSCIREVYAPYDVVVTDEDPGNVPHHEAIAAGTSANVGLDGGTLGKAPGGCEPRNNVISFSFLNMYPASRVDEMCATVAQESAHSFGLSDHLYDCTDPMTYLAQSGECGRKFFRNKLEPCGEFAGPIACQCAGTRVNPHVILLGTFGPGEDPPAPVATITYPTTGATITGASIVTVNATDDRGVFRVEAYLNDWRWGTFQLEESITPPFTFPTDIIVDLDDGYPDGVYDVYARACNDLDICTETAVVTVTKGAACSNADSCLDGQTCDDGRCSWDEPVGEFGDACTYDQYCIGPNTYDGKCAEVGGAEMCTDACFVGVNDTCPDGYACQAGANVCAPESDDGGCCSTGTDGRGELATRLLLIGMIGGLLLRRRRS